MSNSEWCSYSWKVTNQGEESYAVSVAANNLVGKGEATECTPAPIAHENHLLEVKVENHTLSVWCMFLSAFQGVAFCEITLGTDPTFAYLEISPQRSLKTATAGENVSITGVGTLNANTTYYYNVSAVLDDNIMTTPVVVQGFITTPPGELCIYSR